MNTEALIMMLTTQGLVTALTGYFFYRVLTTKPKAEPDSYTENDEEEERQAKN
ncbi:hypothetical protein [Flavobacterium tegetincola]|uniref:hypothetical protein n=1 Tax=Flavobacterium tegetincola TaxID=150172 RepID=UPI00041781BF|nr:hypothetical protein [Flavobacterium tegetincola]